VELGGEVAVRGTVAEPVPQGELELRRGTLDVLARRSPSTAARSTSLRAR
jgi:autotransporter translocation and assembly factor TamB